MALQLAVHGKDIKRTNNVLKNDMSEPLDYDYYKQDDGFYMLNFKGIDYDDFKDIVILLKNNGVNAIGGDKTPEEMNERNIIKLADLIKEQQEEERPNRMETAEDVIEMVDEIITDNPDTALDLLSDMVEDFYENQSINRPDTNLQEKKLKKLIKILVKEWHEQN